MKPRILPLLERCIEDGIELGLVRARKHTDDPKDADVAAAIERAIWEQIHDWFEFEPIPD